MSTKVVIDEDEGEGPAEGTCPSVACQEIANAFFDATGVRLYQYPMTTGYVRAVLSGKG
jgi:CO/xanthine dehydrogenase Mo-binding subunit